MLFCVFQGIVLQPLLIKRIHLHQNQRTNHKEETTLNTKIKCLSLLLALVLVLGMLPAAAMAEGTKPYTFNEEKSSYKVVEIGSTKYRYADIWFDINETAKGNITIDVGDVIANFLYWKVGYVMPSNQFEITVHIQNHSPNAYVYQNNGMTLGTVYQKSELDTEFTGYDGYTIALNKIAGIAYTHPAIKALYGVEGKDFNKVLDTYNILAQKGYTGSEALSDYFLDYYRTKYSKPELTWDELLSTYRDQVIADCSRGGTDNLFYATEERINALKGNALEACAYNVGGTYIQFKWPEEKLAVMSYDLFYQDLLSVVFGNQKVDRNDGSRDHGVGDYVNKNTDPYISANAYLATIGTDGQLDKDEVGTFKMTATLEGQGAGNGYAYYDFGALFGLTLQFVRAPQASTTTPPKTGDNANVQLWLALACLSLSCMAVAFGKARIQSRRKG